MTGQTLAPLVRARRWMAPPSATERREVEADEMVVLRQSLAPALQVAALALILGIVHPVLNGHVLVPSAREEHLLVSRSQLEWSCKSRCAG